MEPVESMPYTKRFLISVLSAIMNGCTLPDALHKSFFVRHLSFNCNQMRKSSMTTVIDGVITHSFRSIFFSFLHSPKSNDFHKQLLNQESEHLFPEEKDQSQFVGLHLQRRSNFS